MGADENTAAVDAIRKALAETRPPAGPARDRFDAAMAELDAAITRRGPREQIRAGKSRRGWG